MLTRKRCKATGMTDALGPVDCCENHENGVWTCVRVLLAHAQPQVAALPHIVLQISAYLDAFGRWTLESGTKAGIVPLLDRLLLREPGAARSSSAFRKARFRNGVELAAMAGRLDVLQWWTTAYLPRDKAPDVTHAILRIAAKQGHMRVLQWVLQDEPQWDALSALSSPLECQHAEIVYWLHERRPRSRLLILMDEPARQGDLKLMQWVHVHKHIYGYEYTRKAVHCAAEAGRLNILQWLRANEPALVSEWALYHAAIGGHIHVIEWLLEAYPKSIEFEEPTTDTAQADVVKFMVKRYPWKNKSHRASWIVRAFACAAGAGHWEMLRYLYDHKPKGHVITGLDRAAAHGDMAMVQWLHERGVKCASDPIMLAAGAGHLKVVQWLHENRTDECTKLAMDFAASNNHLQVVQWLHEHRNEGCSFFALIHAAMQGHLDMVRWIHEHRCERFTNQAMDYAAAQGHLPVIQFLHKHRREGCTGYAMNQASAQGHLDIVQWLHENRSEGCTADAIEKAAINGHHNVVAYLTRHCKFQCSVESLEKAARNGHFEVLAWLLEHDPAQATKVVDRTVQYDNCDFLFGREY